MSVDVDLSERALREIYLPAYKAIVQEADGWTIMSAYNQTLGHYNGENSYLLNDVLKKEVGFTGAVVSDWGGTHSTVKAALSGLDLEMPTGRFFSDDLLQAVKDGQVPQTVIDDKASRILRVMFKAGLFDESVADYGGQANTKQRRDLALKMAQKSIVLLKNDNGFLHSENGKLQENCCYWSKWQCRAAAWRRQWWQWRSLWHFALGGYEKQVW